MIVKKESAQTIRFANGTICSGSEKDGTYKDWSATPGNGAQAEAHLVDILTIAGNKDEGIKPHWKLMLKNEHGAMFGAKLNMSTKQSQEILNNLASIDNFAKTLKINVWQGDAWKKNATKPTVVHFLKDWSSKKDFYRWKYPYLRDGDAPQEGIIYMPKAKQKIESDGTPMENENGYAVRNWNPVNKFLEERIVQMIRAKLQGLAEEVPGEDWLEESKDDLPQSLSNVPANEITQKVNRSVHNTGSMPPPAIPPEEDDLPY